MDFIGVSRDFVGRRSLSASLGLSASAERPGEAEQTEHPRNQPQHRSCHHEDQPSPKPLVEEVAHHNGYDHLQRNSR